MPLIPFKVFLNCKLFKMSTRQRFRWNIIASFCFIVFIAKESACNSIPESIANSISGKSTQRDLFNSHISHPEVSSEIEESFEDESDGGTYNNAEISLMYAEQSKNYSKTTPEPAHTPYVAIPTTTIPPPACSGSCSDKQARENAALDSFKKQLLARLGMEQTPNITRYQKLPDNILEEFCKRTNLPPEYCTGSTSYKNYEYQSDGPRGFEEFDLDVIEEEEDVQYMSAESRIYAFPNSAIKPRHKYYLIFTFAENQKTNNAVLQATLHVFVHSRKFLLANSIEHPQNLKFIDIEIAQIIKGAKHTRPFHVFSNVSVPEGNDGRYVQLNVTDLVIEWFNNREASHGIIIKILSSHNGAQLPHRLVNLNIDDLSKRPYIDILPRDQRKRRTKRSSLKCSKESNEKRCCRHPLTVDFERFGWDWVIAPKKYDANYCAGECKIAFMQRYAHTHVVQLSTAANPCCSPRKMSSIELLYFDEKLNIVLSKIPHMIVEDCFCA